MRCAESEARLSQGFQQQCVQSGEHWKVEHIEIVKEETLRRSHFDQTPSIDRIHYAKQEKAHSLAKPHWPP